MKRFVYTLLILPIIFLSFTNKIYAQMGSMMGLDNNETEVVSESDHGESVEGVLQDLITQQSVSTVQDLNLDKISEDDWARLGDAVMELQHPGEAHEAMDRMMGGEGSESLRQMHINMGRAYLDYDSENSYYGPGMMANNMMAYGNYHAPMSNMMGYGYSGYGIFNFIIKILAISFFVSGTYFFIKKAKGK